MAKGKETKTPKKKEAKEAKAEKIAEIEEKPVDIVEETAAETEKAKEVKEEAEKEQEIPEEEFYVHKKVKSISFGVISPKMIKSMATAKVVTPELYDKEGYPVDGGLMDTRLGVIDPGLRCKTCGSKLKECVGHFGYIELARPVVHIKFADLMLTFLKCTCRECGKILIPKNRVTKCMEMLDKVEQQSDIEARRDKVKDIIASLKTINKCPHCKARQQKITVEKPTTFFENEKRLSPIEVRARLEKISDEDCAVFGVNAASMRPEWGILTVMLIPPVTMRPSITLESGERSEDDLTHKLGDIIRINQRLFENINAGAPEIIIEDLWDLLQYHITTFFDNNVAQLPPARHRSGQPLKTITERIKSKEGRIRHNLAGKRTNFSARTVISPDPMLKLNEVGVPKIVAMKLTVPERITKWNDAYLREFVKRGPEIYPGANYVVRPDGKKKRITEETKEQLLEELKLGYSVERHLIDGDIAIFNRQPSLHRMSMMCHRVRVLPYRTLRLNPTVCHPYNADFDGDEMNLHIPQTEEARAEAEILMEVQTQLISPRYGLSVMGCVQDAISGNYLLTKDISIKRENAVAMLCSIGKTEYSKLPRKNIVSGKEIFSCLLPDDINFNGTSRDGKEVIIKDGILVEGAIDKNSVGEESGLLLRNMHKKYGADQTIEILGDMSKLGVEVLLKYGFTIAISDTDLPEEAKTKITSILVAAEEEAKRFIELYKARQLDTFPGRSIEDTLELKILQLLNKARNEIGNVVLERSHKNTATRIMAESGARGNPLNLAQMAACVGQQAMRGRRIDKGYKDRTLSCFKRKDLSPKSRGFIKNSFKSGMTPAEFFFMGITGRDSLMDTALRTPKSGYLYRRLANALQDLKVEYDGSVRDANGRIIQFMYGDDGIDVSKSEGGKINVTRVIHANE